MTIFHSFRRDTSGLIKEMSHQLFLDSHHPTSNRFAIFEDDGTSAWLYLTEPGNLKPALDAWIYNRIEAPPTSEIKSYYGCPPPAAIGYASETALCKVPQAHDWQIIWSTDGQSVALTKDGVPVGCIVLGLKTSHFRAKTVHFQSERCTSAIPYIERD